jgi:hypothetical protein
MIRETKVALLRVQEQLEVLKLPPLSEVELELNTLREVDARGSVRFLIIELGGGPTTESSTTVKLTLTPPPPGSGTDVANIQLADALAEGILSSARSLVEAKEEASKGKPPLLVSALTVAVKFGLMRSGDGTLSIHFLPLDLKAGGTIKASEIQTVTVTYASHAK